MKVGCDIVENSRFKDVNQEFIDMVLTKEEQRIYKGRIEYLVGRFAAKEAILKSLPNTKKLSFLDIEVLNNPDGCPCCNINGVIVSISHEINYSIAVAINTNS